MSDHSAMATSAYVTLEEPVVEIKTRKVIESPLLPFKQASQYLQISKEMLYRLVARKEIACVRIHRKILFKKRCLDEYIDACEVQVKS